jgi:hypothetical protein
MRRWLLCLVFLTLSCASFAQNPIPISLQASNGSIYGVSGADCQSGNCYSDSGGYNAGDAGHLAEPRAVRHEL